MFCTSLRKRKEWASVPSTLLSQQQRKWQEQQLETHDLAIPLPQRQQDPKDFFRLILLSATDIQLPEQSLPRIERLYQAGGKHIGVIFLLHEADCQRGGNREFMGLQATHAITHIPLQEPTNISSLLSCSLDMPVIPLSSVSSLTQLISAFHRQLFQSHTPLPFINPATALLPYCSNNPPIPEHTRNLLSDICQSIPELSKAAMTPDGRKALKEWLTEPSLAIVEDIIGFWEQEYIAE